MPAESRIWFVGIKDDAVAVPGFFRKLRGIIDVRHRTAWLEVPVAAIDTGLEERDRNLRVHLFEGDAFPDARVVVDVVTGGEVEPDLGVAIDLDVVVSVELGGHTEKISASLRAHREGRARVRVRTREPLVLTAGQLGLHSRFAVLRAVCGHGSLATAVPVELDLVFEATGA